MSSAGWEAGCQALDIFGGDGSVVDVLVDQVVFCVGRVECYFDIEKESVVRETIGTHGLRDEVGRDPGEICIDLDEDAYAICLLLFSLYQNSVYLLEKITTILGGWCSNVLRVATSGDFDFGALKRTVGDLSDEVEGNADWRVFRNGIALNSVSI